MSSYETVIGLEVHVQLKTRTKVFCDCPTDFGQEPNSQICPVCCGYPGVLPVPNKVAVEALLKAALALGCRINKNSVFARKQYFYPDLPKNYQISQYDQPMAEHGTLKIKAGDAEKTVGITRIHMEEDAGKLLHAVGSRALDYSLVDLNRTGFPLAEIVSEPDMRGAEEAQAYLMQLRNILRYVGVSDCDMEKGSMRCDANVSLSPTGATVFGTRAEIKNMNSFKSVKDAIAYEVERQKEILESGGRVVQETRLWDQDKGETRSMRSKEEAHDYRYFPDPDLIPVHLEEAFIDGLKKNLPELPETRRARYENDWGLSPYDAGVLTAEKSLADFFEAGLAVFDAAQKPQAAKPVANWVTTELLGRLNTAKKTIEESQIPAQHVGALVKLILGGSLSTPSAKKVFDEMFASGSDPESIVKAKGLVQVEDAGQIARWVEEALAANEKIVADVKGGNPRAMGALVGAVMKKSSGRANPQTVNRILKEKLSL